MDRALLRQAARIKTDGRLARGKTKLQVVPRLHPTLRSGMSTGGGVGATVTTSGSAIEENHDSSQRVRGARFMFYEISPTVHPWRRGVVIWYPAVIGATAIRLLSNEI